MPIIFDKVSYTYNPKTSLEKTALKNVSFKINDGDFVALVGKTGSGKSTLVQLMNNLLKPTDGLIKINEYEIIAKKKFKKAKELRRNVGLVFQFPENQLFEETVLNDVMFSPLNYLKDKEQAKKQAMEALNLVGLDESFYKRSPFELSGGEKRRVAIAGVLSLNCNILILDEPSAGLDPLGCQEMMDLLLKLNKMGKTIVIVSHDMDLVSEYVNRVILMDEGEIKFDGTSNKLFTNHDSLYSLEMPQVFRFAKDLLNKKMKIDLSKIKDISTLAKEIKRCKN